MQVKQREWQEQWSRFSDDELFLFEDWIYPFKIGDFKGKTVLECGCGGGQHTAFIAPYAKEIVAVDLNTKEIARQRNRAFGNVTYIEDDIARMELGRTFDIVFAVGVVHHTDDPECTVANLKRHVKPGGRLILWVYSKEGNVLSRRLVEPFRKMFLRRMSRSGLHRLSGLITFFLYIPVYTVYLLPLWFLPYFEYFGNFRKLSFDRNCLNVFDKLNAPQVHWITRARAEQWFSGDAFEDIHISPYKNVSWRASGTKKGRGSRWAKLKMPA